MMKSVFWWRKPVWGPKEKKHLGKLFHEEIQIGRCSYAAIREKLMLGLHYVPGGHGNHVSGHRGQNGMDVRQRGGTGWAT